jgi:hypothetical protein
MKTTSQSTWNYGNASWTASTILLNNDKSNVCSHGIFACIKGTHAGTGEAVGDFLAVLGLAGAGGARVPPFARVPVCPILGEAGALLALAAAAAGARLTVLVLGIMLGGGALLSLSLAMQLRMSLIHFFLNARALVPNR